MSNDFSILSSRWLRSLVAVLLVGGFASWFIVNEQRIRKEAWTGVVTEKWEDKPMLRGVGLDAQSKQQRRTKYYLKVDKDNGGGEAKVKVPSTVYTMAGPGKRVEKIYGERYPRVK